MESTHHVVRSRSPIRGHGPVRVPVDPILHRVPVFEDHVVETRVPVVERVERTYDSRSRSPLLSRTYGVSGTYDAARMSAATPTVARNTDGNK